MARTLKSLMERLNGVSRGTLEASAGMCMSHTHYEVEIEHWLTKLIEAPDSDLKRTCHAYGIDPSRVSRELTRTIERFKTGNSRTPTLSPTLVKMVEEAWLIASIEHGTGQIRSGHMLLALLSEPTWARQLRESVPSMAELKADALAASFFKVTLGSPEELRGSPTASASPRANAGEDGAASTGAPSETPSLDKYTHDLTAAAKHGKIDPIVGRDDEVRQVIDILMRRRQNNPILTGEAGVGKTAVVEGFACQIATGQVPPPLRNVALRSLDLGLLQAGAGVKGEFEARLRSVIDEVKASPTPIILFIDEAHTLIGAGGAAGQSDAANLLKPALARGELRTIAATTWSEYKKYIEKDPALTRRFQVVKVEEPDEQKGIRMLRPVAVRLEAHHKVAILSEAVEDAVLLSSRYLTGRQLPDKAVSVLDTACARVAVSQCAVPAPLEDVQRQLAGLELEASLRLREVATGIDHARRLIEIKDEQVRLRDQGERLTRMWEAEKVLVDRILETGREMLALQKDSSPQAAEDLATLCTERVGLEAELKLLQGESPLVHHCVDSSAVAGVISRWTGVPVGKMLKNELATIRSLKEVLGQRIIGQDHALHEIAQRIQTSKASLDDPGKPIGIFLLVGPSGVGKTETAVALSDILYGGERNLITINMSEFQEKHTVSSLKGAPPGYVGYGEGGVLTEAVRRKPYSVLLLDEIEKAHPDVLKLFYQVFDKGQMDDGEGREIDFKNTVILLTSNLGTDIVMSVTERGKVRPEAETLLNRLRPTLLKFLEPALLGRMNVVPYYPLADEQLERIVRLKLDKIGRRMRENQKIELSYTEDVVREVTSRCTEVDSGARNVDHILTRTLLPEVSHEVLGHLAEGRVITRITVDTAGGGFAYAVETRGGA